MEDRMWLREKSQESLKGKDITMHTKKTNWCLQSDVFKILIRNDHYPRSLHLTELSFKSECAAIRALRKTTIKESCSERKKLNPEGRNKAEQR